LNQDLTVTNKTLVTSNQKPSRK